MALKTFNLTKKEEEARTSVYKDLFSMIELRDKKFPHFNGEDGERNLMEYINDSDLRLNGTTPSRAAQGKEEWQSNLFNPVTRTKMKAMVAGVALGVPKQNFKAVNKNGLYSAQRAELIKQLVRHSRVLENPQLNAFFEAWDCAAKGTVVKFDGYLKTKYKRKFIKSYDLETGKVDFEEKEMDVDDRPVDINVPLAEFYIWDFFTYDIQEQPKIAWVRHYSKEQLEQEFGQYRNFKYVQDKSTVNKFESTKDAYFLDKWGDRVQDADDFEVIRYFNKVQDRYEIWCNGVPLLVAPLVWGKADKKYPFSKTIFEPFVGKEFFYGKSFPSVIEGIQDVDNTLLNTILDKTYRSLTPPMLVGLQNKDLFDVESELVNQDNKIYVPDVNAVKPMPFGGVDSGEIQMLQYVARLGDLATVDSNQSGQQGRGVTAREVLVANENARKLKGIFFMFLEDLWIQKTRLRILNILMNYTQPKIEKIIGEDGSERIAETYRMFNVEDTEFSDGSTGTLGVQFVGNKKQLPKLSDIAARENAMEQNGLNYKLVAVTSDYLDNWDLDVEMTTDSLQNQDRAEQEANLDQHYQRMITLFPEYFAANKEKEFKKMLELEGDTIDAWEPPQQQPSVEEQVAQQTGQPVPTVGGEQAQPTPM